MCLYGQFLLNVNVVCGKAGERIWLLYGCVAVDFSIIQQYHCVKSVQIRSLFWSVFPAFGLNTERCKVSLRIRFKCGKRRTRKNSVFGHISRSVSAIPSEFSAIHYFSVMAAFLLLFANDLKFCKLWMCRKRMEFLAQTLTRMFRQTWKTSFKFWVTIFGIQSSKLGINKNLFLYFNRGYLYRLFSDKNESRTNDNDLHLMKYFMVQVKYDMIKGLDEELRIQTLNVFTFAVFYSPLLTI